MTLVRGRSSAVWARRAALAVVLAGAAIIPGRAASVISTGCQDRACGSAGKVLWSRLLPGSWTASPQDGTVPAQGQAYLAAGGGVAAVGSGLMVTAYDLATGEQRWQVPLTGLPAGAAVVSVRAWPGVVTVGVSVPRTRRHPAGRTEFVLGDRTGAWPGVTRPRCTAARSRPARTARWSSARVRSPATPARPAGSAGGVPPGRGRRPGGWTAGTCTSP